MSKKFLTFCAVAMALLLPGAAQAGGQPDYFPLELGMTWTYGDNFHVVRVTGLMKSLLPISIYTVEYMSQSRNFIKPEDGRVLEWRDGKKRLLYDFGAKPGVTWKIEPLGDGSEILDGTVVTVLSTSEEVKVPYGLFKGCVHLGMRPRAGLADAGVTDMWFAPGVGLVKWSEIWIGGVRSHELTAFSYGQTAKPRLKVELTTDRQSYALGDAVAVTYRLTNVTKDPLKLIFRSGQRYDFILEGPKGRVWQWSDGRAFIQVLGAQDLPPGESVVVQEKFNLSQVGAGGEGVYVLRGFMAVTSDAPGAVTREETEVKVKLTVSGSGGDKVPPDSPPGSKPDPNSFNYSNSVFADRNGVRYEIATEASVYRQGDIIKIRYRVIVKDRDSATFQFGSIQQIEFVIMDAEGRKVWVWSDGKGFGEALVRLTLKRGESKGFEEVLKLEAPTAEKLSIGQVALSPGNYKLIGYLPTVASEPGTVNRSETEVAVAVKVVEAATSPRLKVDLTTDRQGYTPGDGVAVIYRLTNVTKESLKLMFRSGQRYDFVLEGPKGRVWGWSDNKRFTQALGAQDLAPGEEVLVQEKFALPQTGVSEEGAYVLRGYMTVTPDAPGAVAREETEARVKFTVGRSGEVRVSQESSSGSQTALIKGDFDRDGQVGLADFFMFADAFGKRSGAPGFEPAFDLDSDGSVGFSDFFLFVDAFGKRQ